MDAPQLTLAPSGRMGHLNTAIALHRYLVELSLAQEMIADAS
jgi:hypothetical protein